MLTFEYPNGFFLFIAIAWLFWMRHVKPSRGGVVPFSFASFGGRQFHSPLSPFSFLAVVVNGLLWLGLSALVLAFTAPVVIEREKVFVSSGMDIMLLIDVSPSMAAQDAPGKSRLNSAAQTFSRFVNSRSNDSIGLVAFGSDAALLCPPTRDYKTLLKIIDSLQPTEFGEGTAIGLGLSVTALHLAKSASKERIVILVSDGDNNAGEINPDAAADVLAALGIRTYTVAIGSSRDVYIEYSDVRSGRRFHGTYQGILDTALLTSVAAKTGGRFFKVDAADGLDSIMADIGAQEQTEQRVRLESHKFPLHGLFIWIGFGFILLEQVFRRLVLRELS